MKLSFSVAIGIFTGVLPIWGFQTILAIFLAFILKSNKFILIAASNISQPPLTPLIIFISFFVGGIFVDKPALENYSSLSSLSFNNCLHQYLIGSIISAFLLAFILGLIAYTLLSFFRKNYSSG
jgi:uncharacterized protein (DUF2062 family)